MIDRLKAKPESERIDVQLGSFGDFHLEQKFQLIYVVFNTIFLLTTQQGQVDCFRNVAAHLTDEGCFVIEAFVPNLNRFQGGQVNWASKAIGPSRHCYKKRWGMIFTSPARSSRRSTAESYKRGYIGD